MSVQEELAAVGQGQRPPRAAPRDNALTRAAAQLGAGRSQLNVTLSAEAKATLDGLVDAAPGVTRRQLVERLILHHGPDTARAIVAEATGRLEELG